jgi:hypothetical protein
MAVDLVQIRKYYASFDDDKIEYLAKYEAGSLEPEVVLILQNEIKKRGLDSNLNSDIEAQTKELTLDELNDFKGIISQLPCPECGMATSPLTGTIIREVKSFVILTIYKKTPLLLCQTCASKKRKKAMNITLLLGWWGIPFGLIRTLQVIFDSNSINNLEKISDIILTNFIIKNFSELRKNRDNETLLVDLIRNINNTS